MNGMRRSFFLVGVAALAFVGGCEKQAARADPEMVKNAIKAAETRWNEQFKAKDTEGVVSHYADDAFFVGPRSKPADGLTSIRKAYADAMTDPMFSMTFTSGKIDVSASGDTAYARGPFSERFTDPKTSKVMTDSGSFIAVYQKQQDGTWKVVEQIVAADPDSTKEMPPERPAVRAKMTSSGF